MALPPKHDSIVLTFKCLTTTLFVFTTQSSHLLSVKEQLYSMLVDNASAINQSIPTPSSPLSISLGLPRDPADLSQGFEEVEYGKLKDKSVLVHNAGFVDGGTYAFKVVESEGDEDEDFDVRFPAPEEDEEEEEEEGR